MYTLARIFLFAADTNIPKDIKCNTLGKWQKTCTEFKEQQPRGGKKIFERK